MTHDLTDNLSDQINTAAEAAENEVLTRSRAAVCDPRFDTCEMDPLPPALTKRLAKDKSPAEWAYERIILYIQNFEKTLDNDHEVGMGFAGGDAEADLSRHFLLKLTNKKARNFRAFLFGISYISGPQPIR